MLTIYSNGLCYCSVCTDIEKPEDVEAEVNARNPTGVTPWTISIDAFRDGTPNGSICPDDPKKKHYLLVC